MPLTANVRTRPSPNVTATPRPADPNAARADAYVTGDAEWWTHIAAPGTGYTVSFRSCALHDPYDTNLLSDRATHRWDMIRRPDIPGNTRDRWHTRTRAWLNTNLAVAVTITDAFTARLAHELPGHPDPTIAALGPGDIADNASITPRGAYTYSFGAGHPLRAGQDTRELADVTVTISAADVCATADRLYRLTHWTAASIETAALIARQQFPKTNAAVLSAVAARTVVADAIDALAGIDPAIIETGLAATYTLQQQPRWTGGPTIEDLVDTLTSIWNP